VGVADRANQARISDRPDLGAHSGRDSDGGHDARSLIWRTADPRPGGVWTAGGRGLVRPVVRAAPRAHA
jgi:hypothetical protein